MVCRFMALRTNVTVTDTNLEENGGRIIQHILDFYLCEDLQRPIVFLSSLPQTQFYLDTKAYQPLNNPLRTDFAGIMPILLPSV